MGIYQDINTVFVNGNLGTDDTRTYFTCDITKPNDTILITKL